MARVKVGEVIGTSTPRAAPRPWVNAVLPAPRSPQSTIKSPGRIKSARAAASRRVPSTDVVDTAARGRDSTTGSAAH